MCSCKRSELIIVCTLIFTWKSNFSALQLWISVLIAHYEIRSRNCWLKGISILLCHTECHSMLTTNRYRWVRFLTFPPSNWLQWFDGKANASIWRSANSYDNHINSRFFSSKFKLEQEHNFNLVFTLPSILPNEKKSTISLCMSCVDTFAFSINGGSI